MAASASSSSKPMTRWGDIPEELKDMMLCHACNLQAYDKDGSVVLPCAHVMCLECIKERLELTATRDKIECPKCAAVWELPFGDILGFPKDVFSLVLNNSLLTIGLGVSRPNPKCALHPREDVSRYCKQCSLLACVMCCEWRHREHVVEKLESQGTRMDRELIGLKNNIIRKGSQIGDILEKLRDDQTNMTADFQWACDEIQEKAQEHIDQLKLQQDKVQQEALEKVDELKLQAVKIQEGAQDNVDELKLRQHKVERQFEQTLKQLEGQKQSLENDQLFIDILYNMGNESDKLSRVSGMKDIIAKGKQFSGRKLELETLKWKFDVDKTGVDMSSLLGKLEIAESIVESLGEDGESLFPGLHGIGDIPISCKPAWGTRSVTLFNQQHIMHTCDHNNADKICIHDTTRAVTHLIPIPGMQVCALPVVVDCEIVAADMVQGWTDEMRAGKSTTHLRGSLHWLTLNNRYSIIKQDVIPIQCVPRGFMNFNHVGHLLVLTHCSTSEHPRQLIVYNNNRRVLHAIPLSDMFARPLSAVSIDSGKFVVVDVGKNQVIWIDQHGQVLQQYGKQPGEDLNDPTHVIQHSNGSLLIADRKNHRVHIVSNEGKLLQYLLQKSNVRYPLTLHLDEQTGLLCVIQSPDQNNTEVKTLHFLPCVTHIKQICLSAQV